MLEVYWENQVRRLGKKKRCLGLQEQQNKSKKERSKSNQEKWQELTKKPPPRVLNKKQLKKIKQIQNDGISMWQMHGMALFRSNRYWAYSQIP